MHGAALEVNPAYVKDASGYTGSAERVFAPSSDAEVVEVIREAVATRTPLTIAGAGSGLTGARVAQGGWVLSVERFRRLEIESGRARAGSAITLLELRDTAVRTGQFYAPDPTEITASVGGTISTNASGARSFRFGSTRAHVLAIRVALMDGSIREYRRGDKPDFPIQSVPVPNTTKYTAGYRLQSGMDAIDLFCGAEGTLGVIIEAELKLLPIPAELFAGVVFFPSADHALSAVDEWRSVQAMRMLEYMDARSLALMRESSWPDIPAEARAALLIEQEGDDVDAWEDRLSRTGALMESSWFAVNAADRERFRIFRHRLPEVVNATVIERGFLKMGSDYAVPIERNREMLAWYEQTLAADFPSRYVIYGHVGDAHLHVNMLPAGESESKIASDLMTRFARHAVELGGTVSAEHGLGKRKRHLLGIQFEPEHIRAMTDVKRHLDPLWLLGRGTLFPVPEEFS